MYALALANRPGNPQRRLGLAALALLLLSTGIMLARWLGMPGKTHSGPLDPLTDSGRSLARQLERDVRALAAEIGERNVARAANLERAARHVESGLARSGESVESQRFLVGSIECRNLVLERPGGSAAEEVVVVGAHYDTALGTPGADDNASGTAALLALAERLHGHPTKRTLRFVAFVNEEPPHFQSPDMGSWRYAKQCKLRGERVVAMLSLESIGYFSTEQGSQRYPPPLGLFFPSRGDFVGFVGNPRSRDLTRACVESFRRHARFPAEGAALPGILPGVGWSDHWAFWQEGYPAVMVTDTAPFRNPHYHQPTDTPDQLDYERLTRVVLGLEQVLRDLGG